MKMGERLLGLESSRREMMDGTLRVVCTQASMRSSLSCRMRCRFRRLYPTRRRDGRYTPVTTGVTSDVIATDTSTITANDSSSSTCNHNTDRCHVNLVACACCIICAREINKSPACPFRC